MTGEAPAHVVVDGQLRAADAAHLSAFDRGFQLGDGVFETLRARSGRPIELREHVRRLESSARALSIELPAGMEAALRTGIAQVLRAESLDGATADASIRITVSRGVSFSRGTVAHDTGEPTIVIQAWRATPPPATSIEHGVHLLVAAHRIDPSDPLSGVKTTSRAASVHAKLAAIRQGADDALFLTTDGHLAEATSANLFLVRDAVLATPALECGILAGTTRGWLLRWGDAVGLRAEERWLSPDELAAADEAFLSSSVAGVVPVTRFEGSPIAGGSPGPWTARARRDRERYEHAA